MPPTDKNGLTHSVVTQSSDHVLAYCRIQIESKKTDNMRTVQPWCKAMTRTGSESHVDAELIQPSHDQAQCQYSIVPFNVQLASARAHHTLLG
jgi:hypothetical protein